MTTCGTPTDSAKRSASSAGPRPADDGEVGHREAADLGPAAVIGAHQVDVDLAARVADELGRHRGQFAQVAAHRVEQ